MRKLIISAAVTLDGVMQAPGGPQEDTDGGFKYGGWEWPYSDERLGTLMVEQLATPVDLLLGRRTYEIFESYWPRHADGWPGIHSSTKYVVSSTRMQSEWDNTVFVKGNVAEEVRKLKQQSGRDLHVYGSTRLLPALFKHDLVDELWLRIFPITLGPGKRLFGEGNIPAAFRVTRAEIVPSGVIVARYQRAGDVKTESVGD